MIDVPLEPLPTQEQIIEQRLIECGLEAKGISVKYEDDLQSIEIIIQARAGATADHFKCINDAAAHEIVTFEDRELADAYNEYTSELFRPQVLEGLKNSLRERQMLEDFPEYRNFADLNDYAKALEAHAGIVPGTALKVSSDRIVFNPPSEGKSPTDFAERYSDLLAIVGYACILERLTCGFVGNEALSK